MDADFMSWVGVVFRFVHVLAAIMWIGNSLLFTWMELSLQRPGRGADGDLLGTLDMLHGGGVYHMEKRVLRPGAIPVPLHWFMWQSYTTWISGFVLLLTLYHAGHGTFFVDASKSAMPGWSAVLWSLGGLVAGWLVYDTIWRSRLKNAPSIAVPLSLGLLFAAAWFFNTMFNGRAVFLQVGAMMGTMMSANVFFHIIANQRKFMAALEAGAPHDVELGKAAKARSLHNHYMTFPVLFLMLSAHFPALTGATWNVAVLAVVVVMLMLVKYLMNARHHFREWLFAFSGVVVVAFASVYILLALPRTMAGDGAAGLAEAGKGVFVGKGCGACHMEGSADLAPELRGVFGTKQAMEDGQEILADESYVRESILKPQAHIAKGYPPSMPSYEGLLTPKELDELVAYIRSVGSQSAK